MNRGIQGTEGNKFGGSKMNKFLNTEQIYVFQYIYRKYSQYGPVNLEEARWIGF